ncbi:tRNA(Ile)-lysidine synthetase [Rhodovulum sp. PH10]|uniref:tRNA lysidine(34) synthetase TilS n=1 Tax=Rhodovulum sp. PH10 TaxID=1187851 RepID=UPI00027C1E00|nr:tRNA lysidine(34) synthetase TilS [Rhodovulum sp. PH10]EJW12487.1 tRNA(Ile)-lysidine synthetase [Rhodovulum sp. PH10]
MSAADQVAEHAARPLDGAEAAALFADLAKLPALVIAVSGGPDSTALLVLAARWRKTLQAGAGPRLLAVTVDHGLRPQAALEAQAVAALAQSLGVPHLTTRWVGEKPATGIQEAARIARYRLLAEAARETGARHVLTAHTRDDQAETVLFRLARGSGVTGLSGMARVAPLPVAAHTGRHGAPAADPVVLVRPFLDVAKARLIATLRAEHIAFAEDASNRDPRYTRARLRALLPNLATEGLGPSRLVRLAERMRRAEAALEAATGRLARDLGVPEAIDGAPVGLDAAVWSRAPAELRLRLLGRLIAAAGREGEVELAKLEACAEALTAAASAADPAAARLRRTLAGAMVTLAGGRLTVEPAPPRRASS